ncbi:MAG: nitroreductase, partial [Deltaproteobacteria bacterium]|nr:nitroreductase [Deltaproteobacteria bacterium]
KRIEMEIISVNHNRCNLCGICVETCGQHIFLMKEKEVRIQREETCITCGQCVSVCPQEAIRHKGLNIQGFLPVREELKISPEQMYHFLRSRRSVRTFEPREVPREMLERLVDIGRYAPTGTNIQDVEFILIQQSAQIAKLSRMAGMFYGRYLRKLEESQGPVPYHTARRMDSFRLYYQFALEGKDRVFRGGQAAILVHGPEANAVAADNCHYALSYVILMAHALGLGTCLLRTFVLAAEQDPEIQREITLPQGHKLFGCVSVGFPKYKYYQMPARKEARVKWI